MFWYISRPHHKVRELQKQQKLSNVQKKAVNFYQFAEDKVQILGFCLKPKYIFLTSDKKIKTGVLVQIVTQKNTYMIIIKVLQRFLKKRAKCNKYYFSAFRRLSGGEGSFDNKIMKVS